jgi:hypothetical protein
MKNKWLSLTLVITGYLLVNIIFNSFIWKDIIYPAPSNILVSYGESPTYEVIAEAVKNNILSGKNPLATYKNIFYPTGWNFVVDDIAPINGFFFIFLRPFFDIHQSLMLIIVFSIFFSNLSMYLLLQNLNFKKLVSFVMGLVYGFTPFISMRFGHPDYVSLYFFPLITLFIILIERSKKTCQKILYGSLLGITGAVLLLTNLYYTVMVFLSLIILGLMLFIFDKKILYKYFLKNILYYVTAISTFLLLLYPWLIKTIEYIKFNNFKTIASIENYIPFSADISNFFLPSKANFIYKQFLIKLSRLLPYTKDIFEDFIYPGLILLIGTLIIVVQWKKIPKIIKIIFSVGFIFLILTLGPYLKIFGKTTSLPLLYAFLYRIPLLQMARAPGRFIVIFIFFATICVTYVINRNLLNRSKKYQILFLLFLFSIFLIDQNYGSLIQTQRMRLPMKIYQNLLKTNHGPVLEIPYSIRDGLRSLGYKHAIWYPWAQRIHQQPIFNIYAGRLSEDIFRYYYNDYLFGSLDKLINEKSDDYLDFETNFNDEKFKQSLDFFNIHSIILKNDEKYSSLVESLITKSGFKKVLKDGEYDLFIKNTFEQQEFLKPDLTSMNDSMLFDGWWDGEPDGRWTRGSVSKILFKTNNKHSLKLQFSAVTIKKTVKTKVYVNKIYIGESIFKPDQISNYSFELGNSLAVGFNEIILRFSTTYRIRDVTDSKNDLREVSLFMKDIEIKNK